MGFSGSSCFLSRGVAPSDRTATLQPRHLANKKDFHPALSQTGICRKGSCGFKFLFFQNVLVDYARYFTANGKVFWEPTKIEAKFGTMFQPSRFLVFFCCRFLSGFSRQISGGNIFFVFPCESFRISDPAVSNDEILVGA